MEKRAEMETDIIIKTMWEETMDGLDEVEVTTEIYCTECGHEFDMYDYDKEMIEDMKYCPFCGKKIRRIVYE
jgi:DNA-directed RNA polymerase subunit RPC12/RpoP